MQDRGWNNRTKTLPDGNSDEIQIKRAGPLEISDRRGLDRIFINSLPIQQLGVEQSVIA